MRAANFLPMNDPTDTTATQPRRSPIRSYVLRAGRMGPGQARALEALGPRYLLPYVEQVFNFDSAFGRCAPQVLEIGFGMGDATASIARGLPGTDFIGIEVHPPGVGALLKRIGELCLTNLRMIQHDAVDVLRHMVAPESLQGIHVFFPDPWHKKKHNKRRLIQPEFVALLGSRLRLGRNHVSQHVDGIMLDHAQVGQAEFADALEQRAHARRVHFDADDVGTRKAQGDARRGVAHAEADFQHLRRNTAECRVEIECLVDVGQYKARPQNVERASLPHPHSAGAKHIAANRRPARLGCRSVSGVVHRKEVGSSHRQEPAGA